MNNNVNSLRKISFQPQQDFVRSGKTSSFMWGKNSSENKYKNVKLFAKFLICVFFLGLVAYAIYNNFAQAETKKILGFLTKQSMSSNLQNIVETTLSGTKGTYAVAIKNLKTGESYYTNEHRVFDAGSLYKIWVLATAYDQIEKGKLKEDEILSSTIPELNAEFNISSKSAEITKGEISLSVKSAVQQMIIISHNYSALLLTKRMKLSTMEAFLKENNFSESSFDPPKTTAYDVSVFFEKLYKGQLGGVQNAEKMMDLFKKQTLNNKLPKLLPEDSIIAHKTGEIGHFTHDAGIVFLENNDYIIVVMSESTNPAGAEERIAQLSKTIYEYFTK